MSQEKRPTAPAAIVQRYDPRQSPAPAPQSAAEPANPPATGGPTPAAMAQPATVQPTTIQPATIQPTKPVEIGGPSGPEPTRYGDWERNGRVSDF